MAEIEPELVEWGRGPMVGIFGNSLVDPWLELLTDDVGMVIREAPAAYDAGM